VGLLALVDAGGAMLAAPLPDLGHCPSYWTGSNRDDRHDRKKRQIWVGASQLCRQRLRLSCHWQESGQGGGEGDALQLRVGLSKWPPKSAPSGWIAAPSLQS